VSSAGFLVVGHVTARNRSNVEEDIPKSEKLHKIIEFDEEPITKCSKLPPDWAPVFNTVTDIDRILILSSVTNASKNVQSHLLEQKQSEGKNTRSVKHEILI
jgi:hypothetical protein